MRKWYRSCALTLIASMALQMSGCASQQSWLSRVTGRDQDERRLADSNNKSKSKSSTAKKSSTDKSGSSSKSSDSELAKKSPSTKSSTTKPKSSSEIAKKDSTKRDDSKYPSTDRSKTSNKELAGTQKTKSGVGRSDSEMSDDNDLLAGTGSYGSKRAESTSKSDTKTGVVSKKTAPADPFEDFEPQTPIAQTSATNKTADTEDFDFADEPAPKKATKPVREASHQVEDDLAQLTDLPDWALSDEPKSAASAVKKQVQQKSEGISRQIASRKEAAEESLDQQFDAISVSKKKVTRDIKEVNAELRETLKEPAPASPFADARSINVALLSLCPDAEGELREQIRALNPNDVEGLKRSLHKIGRMGTEGAAAAPACENLLKHKDGFVRVHAALALTRMQKSPPEAIQTVVDGLKASDPGLRSFSAATLAEMGPQAGEALTKLADSLDDRDGYVRLHAAEVLIRYDQWSYRSLEALLGCLNDRDENVRWLATYSLAELAPETPETVAALAKATRDPVLKVQTGAVYALGEIGPFAKNAAQSLHRLADETNQSELQSAVMYALQQIEK